MNDRITVRESTARVLESISTELTELGAVIEFSPTEVTISTERTDGRPVLTTLTLTQFRGQLDGWVVKTTTPAQNTSPTLLASAVVTTEHELVYVTLTQIRTARRAPVNS